MVRKGFGDEPFKDVTMERVRVEEFEESLCEDCGWVNLVFLWGFSLNILSGSFLHFVGMRGICTYVCLEWEESVFQNRTGWRLGLATWLSCKFKPRTNRMTNLDFLSYSAPVGMTLQLLCMLGTCATSSGLQAARYLRDPVASPCYFVQTWAVLHTLSHTTLTWFPPKYRVTNC